MAPEIAVVALAALFTLCYLGVCATSPFGPCRKCNGMGFQITTTRAGRHRRGKDCRRCRGHGYRIRTGRRLLNFLADLRRHR